jgi:hypothetical protein
VWFSDMGRLCELWPMVGHSKESSASRIATRSIVAHPESQIRTW